MFQTSEYLSSAGYHSRAWVGVVYENATSKRLTSYLDFIFN